MCQRVCKQLLLQARCLGKYSAGYTAELVCNHAMLQSIRHQVLQPSWADSQTKLQDMKQVRPHAVLISNKGNHGRLAQREQGQDLVEGNHKGCLAHLEQVDGLNGLLLQAVHHVNYQDGNVTQAGPARPQVGEGLVTCKPTSQVMDGEGSWLWCYSTTADTEQNLMHLH